jgi:hypothetical protein
MDWQPSPAATPDRHHRSESGGDGDDGRGTGNNNSPGTKMYDVEFAPQRFFAPEEPTGLEGMFEAALGLGAAKEESTAGKGWQKWLWR